MIQKIKSTLNDELDAPFSRFKSGTISLGDFLHLLEQIPLTQRPRFKTPKELSG